MFSNNFLLHGTTAKSLYENIAKNAPIYDFHCHLSAKEIYENNIFTNTSKVLLEFDHYKWRAMRYAGIEEKYITGHGNDLDKFKMWAKTSESLIGSPLYHWTNLELKNYFGIEHPLKYGNAEIIYKKCNEKIKAEKLTPVKFITQSKVKLICTTDDPTDDLEYHKLISENTEFSLKVLPTFRPDKAINILNKDFNDYITKLSTVSAQEINNYEDLLSALRIRLEYFSTIGCKLSDHSIESLLFLDANEDEIDEIFKKRLSGESVSIEEAEKYKCFTLKKLSKEYHKLDLIMQLHIGAMRNNNSKMHMKIGADAGFDIMNDFSIAPHLSKLLDEINTEGILPKIVLYNLNPKDNLLLSSIPHCFSEEGVTGKIQFGAAWWFNDHKDGIYKHLKALGEQGMLAHFIGMLTDSRSFLSYVRHDYFRRILCNFVGDLVDNEEFENDPVILKKIIEGICFKNIQNYLSLEDE